MTKPAYHLSAHHISSASTRLNSTHGLSLSISLFRRPTYLSLNTTAVPLNLNFLSQRSEPKMSESTSATTSAARREAKPLLSFSPIHTTINESPIPIPIPTPIHAAVPSGIAPLSSPIDIDPLADPIHIPENYFTLDEASTPFSLPSSPPLFPPSLLTHPLQREPPSSSPSRTSPSSPPPPSPPPSPPTFPRNAVWPRSSSRRTPLRCGIWMR